MSESERENETEALRSEIAERRTDPAFAARLRERMAEDKPILDALTESHYREQAEALIADLRARLAHQQALLEQRPERAGFNAPRGLLQNLQLERGGKAATITVGRHPDIVKRQR